MRHNKENGKKNDEEDCAKKEVIQGKKIFNSALKVLDRPVVFFSLDNETAFCYLFLLCRWGTSPVTIE
jgi:hypothetical protein